MSDLTFEQVITLLTVAGGGIGVLLTYAKAVAPALLRLKEKEAEEKAKDRAHEREMQEAQLASEQSEEVARWDQMVKLQNSREATLNTLLDFVVNLATERLEKQDQSRHELHTQTAALIKELRYEQREARTSLSILVGEATRQEEYRRQIKAIPGALLNMQNQQADLYARLVEYLGNGQQAPS